MKSQHFAVNLIFVYVHIGNDTHEIQKNLAFISKFVSYTMSIFGIKLHLFVRQGFSCLCEHTLSHYFVGCPQKSFHRLINNRTKACWPICKNYFCFL